MQVELAYGKTGLPLALPDDLNVTVIEPRYVPGVPDPAGLLDRALAAPIGSAPLAERVRSSDRVGIVFSDITRPTPNEIIIPAILRALSHVPDAQITLFNATGTHRPNTYDELRRMLGDGIVERLRIVQNDARAEDAHVRVGETPGGNTIWLLREFVECDVHILTGFIEPHFFAGFSGGGKAVMPGLARLDTIMHNHRAAHIDDSRARWGITDGNPLWEDVRAAADGPEYVSRQRDAQPRQADHGGVRGGSRSGARARLRVRQRARDARRAGAVRCGHHQQLRLPA